MKLITFSRFHTFVVWKYVVLLINVSIKWEDWKNEWKCSTSISFGWKISDLSIFGLLIFMAYNLIAPFMTSIYHFLGMKVLCIPPINIIILQLLISTLFKYSSILITAATYPNVKYKDDWMIYCDNFLSHVIM